MLSLNPYAAPHGGRLHKWHAIANMLRQKSVDIDFRRARDRTTLLLDQWRSKDFHSLRRCASGNQQEQEIKEKLLSELAVIENAAKPRENLSQWRPRLDGSLAPLPHTPCSSRKLTAGTSSDSPAGPAVGLTDPSTDASPSPSVPTDNQVGLKFATLSSPSHLQSLVGNPDAHGLSSQRPINMVERVSDGHNGNDQSLQLEHGPPPNKLLKNNLGQRSTNPAYSYGPENGGIGGVIPGSDHHTPSPPTHDLSSFHRVDVALTRDTHHSTAFKQNGSAPTDHPTSLHMSLPHASHAAGSPAPVKSPSAQSEIAQLREKIALLEDQVKELKRSQRSLEQQLQWERERESRRLQLERERMDKEFEDRKAEREERRERELRDKEERDRLMQILARRRLDPNLSDGDNVV